MADGQLATALLAAAAVLVLLVLLALLVAAGVLMLSQRRACPSPGNARAADTPATTAQQHGPALEGERSWQLQARLRVLEGTCAGLGRRTRRGSALLEQGQITFTPRRWTLWGQRGQRGQRGRWARTPLVVPVAVVAADGSGRPSLGAAFSLTSGARRLVVPTRTGAVMEVVTSAPVSIAAVYALTATVLTAADPGTGSAS